MKNNKRLLVILGQLLREQRQLRKITLNEVAHCMGLSHTVIANLEYGRRRLDVGEFVTYCQFLQVKPCVLLERAISKLHIEVLKEKRSVTSYS